MLSARCRGDLSGSLLNLLFPLISFIKLKSAPEFLVWDNFFFHLHNGLVLSNAVLLLDKCSCGSYQWINYVVNYVDRHPDAG